MTTSSTNIRKIYLDMDDVLVECTVDAIRHMGLHDFQREDYPDVGRDIYAAYEQLTGLSLTPAQWWEHFKREWWATITPTPWCFDLLDLVCEFVECENVFLLTTPTKCGDCLAGKLDWIHEYLPKWIHRQYNMTPRKRSCAAPGSVLIDDADDNIRAFQTNDPPGWGITFPQPWNSKHYMIGCELDHVRSHLQHWRDK